jgi:nucleoside-diphosphate-sugar epimerase
MKNVLITGGSGFTGNHLARRLYRAGCNVRLILRDSAKVQRDINYSPEIIIGDIRDRDSVRKATKGIDTIFNLAALYRTAGAKNHVYYDVHVVGTRNLLRASFEFNIERFVHCSTVGVHGHISAPPADEESSYNPADIYQHTKLQGELLVRESYETVGVPFSVVRPCAIYGPGDLRLLKLFKLASKLITPIVGDGEIYYHMVHVSDLVDGFILAAKHPNAVNQVFIIGGEQWLTLNDLITMIKHIKGMKDRCFHMPALPFQLLGGICEKIFIPIGLEPPIYRRRVDFFTKSRAFSIEKAQREIEYKPKIDLSSGLKQTYDWYMENNFIN